MSGQEGRLLIWLAKKWKGCFVRRIWAYEVSLFVPHSHNIAHPA